MPTRLLKTVTLLAFTTCATLALAADPPARVGRVALASGEVRISAGEEASAALVNWPVTSRNVVTTAPGARTELRVGSSSIRLDGDSSLEVVELDDDRLRLRLQYGSASVRIVNADVLAGFELTTPQARVRMQQPGRLRVDAERVPDTSTVDVFDGVALVDGGGSTLTIRAGRRAELRDDDVRTAQASRDAFDDWSLARDQYGERSNSTRYVTQEMTGYEELDRYGSWRDDSEYGPLWLPSVSPGWVPYRDGRWTWLDPWGWTWVDNAPWGYAPFHYGRWVHVNRRWAWAPGRHDRHDRRPVWAPALAGQRGPAVLPRAPKVVLSQALQNVPGAAAPVVRGGDHRDRDGRDRHGRDHDGRDHDGRGHDEHDRFGRDRFDHGDFGPRRFVPNQSAPAAGPVTILTPPPAMPGQPAPANPVVPVRPEPRQPVTILTPAPVVPGQPAPPPPHWQQRHDGRDDGRHRRPEAPAAPPQAAALPAPIARRFVPQPQVSAQPAQAAPAPEAAPAPLATAARALAPARRNPMQDERRRGGVDGEARSQER